MGCTQTLFLVARGCCGSKKVKETQITLLHTQIYMCDFGGVGLTSQGMCAQMGGRSATPHLPDWEGFCGGSAIRHHGRIPLDFQR